MCGKKTSWENSPFFSPSLCYSVSVSLAHSLSLTRCNKRGPGCGEALPCDSLSHCVSLLSATEKTSPQLMWHCATRPSRLGNVPLVNSYGARLYHTLGETLSETQAKKKWKEGRMGFVCGRFRDLAQIISCIFCGLVARVLIAAWPVGILFLTHTKPWRDETSRM